MDYTTKLSNNTNPSFNKTREEEIRQAADAIDIKVISNPWILFQKGAIWADITMIDKACQWLKSYVHIYCDDDGNVDEKELIEQFKKAMKQ